MAEAEAETTAFNPEETAPVPPGISGEEEGGEDDGRWRRPAWLAAPRASKSTASKRKDVGDNEYNSGGQGGAGKEEGPVAAQSKPKSKRNVRIKPKEEVFAAQSKSKAKPNIRIKPKEEPIESDDEEEENEDVDCKETEEGGEGAEESAGSDKREFGRLELKYVEYSGKPGYCTCRTCNESLMYRSACKHIVKCADLKNRDVEDFLVKLDGNTQANQTRKLNKQGQVYNRRYRKPSKFEAAWEKLVEEEVGANQMDPESKPAHVSKRCARRPGATGATAIEKGKKARRCAADGSSASKMATVECKQEPQPTDNGFGDCGVLDRCEPGWLVEDACAGGHEVCERWQRSSWGPSHCDGASQGGASGSAYLVASVDIAARARMSIKPIIVEWQDTKKRSKKSQGKGKPRNFPARPDTATDITGFVKWLKNQIKNEGSRGLHIGGVRQFLSIFDKGIHLVVLIGLAGWIAPITSERVTYSRRSCSD